MYDASGPLELRDDVNGVWTQLTANLPDLESVTRWATTARSRATVTLTGTVSDNAVGHEDVVAVSYEVYEQQANSRLAEIALAAKTRWTEVDRVALLHRTGSVALREPSVLVVASAPHSTEAFTAARFCIDVLRATVPIWKIEHAGRASGRPSMGTVAQSVASASASWTEVGVALW